jgi:hypothetical protein
VPEVPGLLASCTPRCTPRSEWEDRPPFDGALETGEPNDPAVFVRVVPSWTVGETFLVTAHQRLRIVAIDFDRDNELVEQGINAVFTVESA